MKGLWYETDFITKSEESLLLKLLNQEDWCLDLKRRTQHYGYKYDYTKKRVDESMKVAGPPSYLLPFLKRVRNHFPRLPDQVIVNEYQPGQQIAPHIDCIPCFGPVVASLTLGAKNEMKFSQPGKDPKFLDLVPRSLIVLSDQARYDWRHSLPPQSEGTRISLTFRTVEL